MAFFTDAQQLASLFTPAQFHNPEIMGKYLPSGLKPIEEFCTDIMQNLIEWAHEGNCIFYKTKEHWYVFEVETKGEWKGVVWMTRFDRTSWVRIDSWANKSSVANMGKAWLLKSEQLVKQVPMYPSRRAA